MDWASTRHQSAETILPEFPARHPTPHASEFSPFVSGLLATGTTPAVAGDWPMSHVTRNSRNDFQFEFSLSAGPEFDTESADGADERHLPDDDNVSTDFNQGTSTSEDTSVGIDAPAGNAKDRFMDRDDIHHSPAMSPVTPDDLTRTEEDDKKNIKQFPGATGSPNGSEATEGSLSSKPTSSQRPQKTIQKKKSGALAKKTIAKTPSSSNPPPSISQGNSAGQSGGLSHTKMCRDRLNNMFERLRCTLPPAPAGVEVKHKAQVLDYAIMVLKGMVNHTSQLEIELAVSSNKATMEWISKLVSNVDTFLEAAEEVMRLFTKRRSWKHAELWIAGKTPIPEGSDPEEATLLTYGTSVVNEALGRGANSLEQFSKESESYAFRAKEGVPGRVWSAMRPEWVTGLTDGSNFKRSNLARKHGVKVCLAVPVTITGKIEAVMCFYDVKHRPYDTQCRELAMRLAWALGNAVGGKRAKVNVLSASGTSNT